MNHVMLLNGSPHAHGCTYTALNIVAEQLQAEGITTEIIHVGHLPIHGCVGCYQCQKLGRCAIDNDIVNEIGRKFAGADGIVIGTPVYFGAPAGAFVALLNRLFYSLPADVKRMKVGAAVTSSRRAGTITALDQLNKYFLHGEMPIASSRCWNEVHGQTPEQVLQDEEGCQTMRVLGRNMAFLIKAVANLRQAGQWPEQEPRRIATNFIR